MPVDPFPLAALPEAFRPWVDDVAERMQCPADFVAVPLLVAAASLVSRHVGIRVQQYSDWQEPGNLWALIVGRPGQMKSPALSQALAALQGLEKAAAERYANLEEKRKQHAKVTKLRDELKLSKAKALLKENEDADLTSFFTTERGAGVPTRARYIVMDTTYEKLGEIMAENPHGVLAMRDEMRGLCS